MVSAVVEPADSGGGPPSYSMGQIHGNLPIERCRLSIATNPPWPQAGAHHGINSCQGKSVAALPKDWNVFKHFLLRFLSVQEPHLRNSRRIRTECGGRAQFQVLTVP